MSFSPTYVLAIGRPENLAKNGELFEGNYREGETISQLQPPPTNTTANLPSNTVNLNRDSCVQYVITGNTQHVTT